MTKCIDCVALNLSCAVFSSVAELGAEDPPHAASKTRQAHRPPIQPEASASRFFLSLRMISSSCDRMRRHAPLVVAGAPAIMLSTRQGVNVWKTCQIGQRM